MLPRLFRRRTTFSQAHGRARDAIARDIYNVGRRGILERLPVVGEWLFRKRLMAELKRRGS